MHSTTRDNNCWKVQQHRAMQSKTSLLIIKHTSIELGHATRSTSNMRFSNPEDKLYFHKGEAWGKYFTRRIRKSHVICRQCVSWRTWSLTDMIPDISAWQICTAMANNNNKPPTDLDWVSRSVHNGSQMLAAVQTTEWLKWVWHGDQHLWMEKGTSSFDCQILLRVSPNCPATVCNPAETERITAANVTYDIWLRAPVECIFHTVMYKCMLQND